MFAGINNDRMIIGYDLANACSQISYCYIKDDSNVETVSPIAGEENYDIPTVLCKRRGANQWLCGNEALRYCREYPDEGILVENILQMAVDGEIIRIDGKGYRPISLLTLFIKRSLSLLAGVGSADRIAALMFTGAELTPALVDVLGEVSLKLDLKRTRVYFQDYAESFYHYMLYQPKDLWKDQSLLLDYREEKIKSMRLTCNEKTRPIVVYMEETQHAFDGQDESLLQIAQEVIANSSCRTSSVYLIGEKFTGDWMPSTLRYLCEGRRVFQGNNLYSKGACFSLLEKIQVSQAGTEHVYLGGEKLKANVGMKVFKRGEESYFALLDGGVNWYETEYTCELYLQDEDKLEFVITPLIGRNVRYLEMSLDGLGLKEGDTTRIQMHLYFLQENIMCVEVSDLGFGSFRLPAEAKWRKEMELYE